MHNAFFMYRILFVCFISTLTSYSYSQTAKEKERFQQAIKLYETGKLNAAEKELKSLSKNTSQYSADFSIQVLNNLGNVFADQGKNVAAIEYYSDALFKAKQAKKQLDQGKILKNIGAIHMSMGNFKKAEHYYSEALSIANSLKNEKLIADCYNNLGTVYEQTGELNEAKTAYFTALTSYTKQQSFADIAMVSSNVAIVCKAKEEFDSCLFYNEIALKAAQSLNDQWMEAAIANNIGNLYGEQGNLEKALKYLNQSLKAAQSINALEIEIMSLESISDAYAKAGKHEKALEFLKKMQQQQKQFDDLALKKSIEELEIKYQTKEKDLLAEQLQKEKQNTLLLSIAGILIVIAISGVWLIVKRKRLNEQYFSDLNAVTVESEMNTRMKIASDLHDHIGQKIAVLQMHSSQIEQTPIKEQFKNLINELGSEVRGISHSLVPEAFQFGLSRSLEELKSELEKTNAIRVDLAVQKSAFENFTAANNLLIYRVVQEIVSNVLKHAQATLLSIQIVKEEQFYTITIQDNGKGFETKTIKRSSGIGWKTIDARLQSIKASFKVNSDSKGTTVTIKIPENNE